MIAWSVRYLPDFRNSVKKFGQVECPKNTLRGNQPVLNDIALPQSVELDDGREIKALEDVGASRG